MWESELISKFRQESPLTSTAAVNFTLKGLLAAERNSLLQHLSLSRLRFNDEVYAQGDQIRYLYFPIDSVLSSLVIMEDGTTIETSMVGKEGLAGVSAILGSGEARHWTRVTVSGSCIKVDATFVSLLFSKNSEAQKSVLEAYRSLITQVSQRAVCNARHTILERLCCWLLMLHDRVGDQNLRLTQEAIAGRVGARRAGITVAAHMLQAAGGIAYRRGELHIVDRDMVKSAACECYTVLGSEFEEGRRSDFRTPWQNLGSLKQ
jgi:CRP-like cAMP-binding protein